MSWKGGPRSQIATCKTFPSAPPVFTITLKHTPNLVWSQTLCFILDKGLGTNGLNLCNRCKLRFSNLDPVWGLYFALIGQFLERGCNWEKRKIDPFEACLNRVYFAFLTIRLWVGVCLIVNWRTIIKLYYFQTQHCSQCLSSDLTFRKVSSF